MFEWYAVAYWGLNQYQSVICIQRENELFCISSERMCVCVHRVKKVEINAKHSHHYHNLVLGIEPLPTANRLNRTQVEKHGISSTFRIAFTCGDGCSTNQRLSDCKRVKMNPSQCFSFVSISTTAFLFRLRNAPELSQSTRYHSMSRISSYVDLENYTRKRLTAFFPDASRKNFIQTFSFFWKARPLSVSIFFLPLFGRFCTSFNILTVDKFTHCICVCHFFSHPGFVFKEPAAMGRL